MPPEEPTLIAPEFDAALAPKAACASARRRRRSLAAAALAGALALPAQAAIVVGTFDPAFGPLIPNLGFRGTVTVNVPDACFAVPAGFIPNADACSGNAMSLLAATVDLYNLNTPGLPTLQNLVFGFGAGAVNGVVTGFDIGTLQNELLGVDTAFSSLLLTSLFDAGPTVSAADDINFSGTLKLRFVAVPPALQIPGNEPFYAAYLYGCQNPPQGGIGGGCAESKYAPTVFQKRPVAEAPGALPEPGTLALIGLAAGLLLLGRRRRG